MNKLKALLLPVILFISFQVIAAEPNFTLTVPAGWTKNEKSVALAHYQKEIGSFIVTADYIPGSASTPDAYVSFVKEQFSKTFKSITFENVVKGKKDGFETRELKYVAEMSGLKMKYDVLYIFNNGKAYTLTGGNMSDMFDEAFANDLKSFFASFKFK